MPGAGRFFRYREPFGKFSDGEVFRDQKGSLVVPPLFESQFLFCGNRSNANTGSQTRGQMMVDMPADRSQEGAPGKTTPLPANFVETATPEISVPELLARVQEEVARRRKADSSVGNSPENVPGSYLGTGRRSRSYLDWGIITVYLGIAEKNALVGKHVPNMKHLPGPIRMVARVLGSGFLYVLRMITNPQREFNHAIL